MRAKGGQDGNVTIIMPVLLSVASSSGGDEGPPEEIYPYYQGGEGKNHWSTHQVTPQIWRPSSPSTVLQGFVSRNKPLGVLG